MQLTPLPNQPIILEGGDPASRLAYIQSLFPPTHTAYLELSGTELTSIGVELTAEFLLPLATTSSVPRVVYIEPAHKLTPAAQNTLLKSLEEPPTATHFVLALDRSASLLATIRSRCQLIRLASADQAATTALPVLRQLLQQSPGERLATALTLGKDRETLQAWLADLTQGLKSTPLAQSPASAKIVGRILSLLNTASVSLRHNGNVTLVRDHLVLSLPKVK